jgi:predicted nucleic acid-binding protein
MLEADGLEVREMAAVARALALYREVASLDFADAYVAGRALEDGPQGVASFDSDFDRVAGIRRLSA